MHREAATPLQPLAGRQRRHGGAFSEELYTERLMAQDRRRTPFTMLLDRNPEAVLLLRIGMLVALLLVSGALAAFISEVLQ